MAQGGWTKPLVSAVSLLVLLGAQSGAEAPPAAGARPAAGAPSAHSAPAEATQAEGVHPEWNPHNPAFRAFYGGGGLYWSWEILRSGEYEIAYHIFPPRDQPRGTVFLVHGFLEHTALTIPSVRILVDAGWEVVGIDLPGHGLSSGPRATIDDFATYGRALLAVEGANDWPRPWRGYGHSTGCAALVEAEALAPGRLDSLFFEAPLVRSWAWGASVFGYTVLGWLNPSLPSGGRGSSRDPAFVRLMEGDPLRPRHFPLSWFKALEGFQGEIKTMGPFAPSLTLIQGGDDRVVDAAYNLPLLASLFPKHSIHMIPGARHYLFRDPARGQAESILAAWASDGESPLD
ncbi:MAG: alpha/beta hydrolase [Treponema sp.]|nr:alpha/beta hydrolase [Treponema sp.]